MKRNKNIVTGMLALVVSVVAVGIAYAGFTGTLNINGTGNVTAAKWDIYFANLTNVVKTGSANVVTPATIKTKTSIGDYEVEFYTPGDSLSYTFDIVNDGSFDASISSLVKNSPTCTGSDSASNTNVCNNLTYTLKYVSSGKDYNVGDNVSVNDTLAVGEVRRVRMLLKLNPNMSASSLPTSDVVVSGLGITIIYSQSSNNGGDPALQEGEIAKFLPGEELNVKFKQLSGTDTTTNGRKTQNVNVLSIQRSNTLDITPTDDNIVSSSDSDIEIYAWFNSGTLYYYSTADTLYLNENSFATFDYFSNLASIDLTTVLTSKVTTMKSIFQRCSSLTTLDLSNFDTSNVTDMRNMFNNCNSLAALDLSSFDTSNVTDMSSMFYNCTSLETLDLSSFDTSNVTNMSGMFYNCALLETLDLSSFDTGKVTNMEAMFMYCSSLTTLDLSSFDTSKITSMAYMFSYCSSLTSLDLSSFDTSKITSMAYMFSNCFSLTSLDLSSFNTSNVTNMQAMFQHCRSLKTLDLSNFDTANVTDMSYMFSNGYNTSINNLIEINGIENWNTSKVTTMFAMFAHQVKLKELDLSGWNTSNVTDMGYMFSDTNLETIYVGNNFITTQVTNSTGMFEWNNVRYSGLESTPALVGGSNTHWDSSHTDKEYARIDDPTNNKPGYFTYKSN